MNESIVVRAANKYRQWMTEEADRPYNYSMILNKIDSIIEKSMEMKSWTNRLKIGMTQKVIKHTGTSKLHKRDQYAKMNISNGIVCPSVYKNIATHMIPDIGGDITAYLNHLLHLLNSSVGEGAHIITPLPLRDLCDEIRVISEAWPTEYLNGELSVVITGVVLEDVNESVDLGNFRMRLRLYRPLEGLIIESINKVESSGGYNHPHVSSGSLCTGDGGLAMKDALCQGRLEDYFRVVEAILRTYNDSSPYESLTEWYDPSHEEQFHCDVCEEWRSNDESYYCTSCDSQACSNCVEGGGNCTSCGDWKCNECCTYCRDCEETICHDCEEKCANCGESACEGCLKLCTGCENSYCSGCYSESCSYCGDIMCDNCIIACKCCEDKYCNDCISGQCDKCSEVICESCKTTCGVCDKETCETCKNKCKDCGNPMCQSCADEHTCLLSGVSDAK